MKKILEQTKRSSLELSKISAEKKNSILRAIIKELESNKTMILNENKFDVDKAKKKGRNLSFIYKLTLDEIKFDKMIEGILEIITLDDPIGELIESNILKNKIQLDKVRVPIGVLGIIYESRPNVTLDVAALCIKSGNAVVLKGGSDALRTNKSIVKSIQMALEKEELSKEAVTFLEITDYEKVGKLLKMNDYIDVIIPRGGTELVNAVVKQSTIPVLYHANGGARIYVDKDADLTMAEKIILNSKIKKPGVCNALNTVVIHKDIEENFLPIILKKFKESNVKIIEGEYQTEYLDMIVSIKIVKDINEAIDFINKYSNLHSEGIVTNNKNTIDKFTSSVDSAALFINCSTGFHDGKEFGLGAEMGIATGKLHARGPVGLKELTTYKWIVRGNGQLFD